VTGPVLIIDDEPPIRRALALNLATRGYTVVQADSGEAGIRAVAVEHPSCILLDLGLPGIDGIGVIEALRGWTDVPIIVLTARDDETSKVRALDAGADDYVTKPFGMGELIARLRATLRRVPIAPTDEGAIEADAFRLDQAAHRAFLADGSEARLTRIEWEIAAFLGRHPGKLVTHRQLVTAVWGPDYKSDPALLRVHMAHIRKKLERDPSHPVHFLTDSGVGYRFEPGTRA